MQLSQLIQRFFYIRLQMRAAKGGLPDRAETPDRADQLCVTVIINAREEARGVA
jgi:hypothetical protein